MATGDDLFGLAPEDFVAARDSLVRTLKAAGDKAQAQVVAKLRRPSVPAWALNQLARSRPDDIAGLLAAAATLQTRPADVRQAMATYRDAAKEATAAAASVLRDSGRDPDQHLAEIRATIDAAGTDAELAAALRAGRLERAGGSFDAVFADIGDRPAAGTEDALAAKRAARIEAADTTVHTRRTELTAAEAEVKAATKAAAAAQRRLDAATAAHDRAAAALERAERDRRRLP